MMTYFYGLIWFYCLKTVLAIECGMLFPHVWPRQELALYCSRSIKFSAPTTQGFIHFPWLFAANNVPVNRNNNWCKKRGILPLSTVCFSLKIHKTCVCKGFRNISQSTDKVSYTTFSKSHLHVWSFCHSNVIQSCNNNPTSQKTKSHHAIKQT